MCSLGVQGKLNNDLRRVSKGQTSVLIFLRELKKRPAEFAEALKLFNTNPKTAEKNFRELLGLNP